MPSGGIVKVPLWLLRNNSFLTNEKNEHITLNHSHKITKRNSNIHDHSVHRATHTFLTWFWCAWPWRCCCLALVCFLLTGWLVTCGGSEGNSYPMRGDNPSASKRKCQVEIVLIPNDQLKLKLSRILLTVLSFTFSTSHLILFPNSKFYLPRNIHSTLRAYIAVVRAYDRRDQIRLEEYLGNGHLLHQVRQIDCGGPGMQPRLQVHDVTPAHQLKLRILV